VVYSSGFGFIFGVVILKCWGSL